MSFVAENWATYCIVKFLATRGGPVKIDSNNSGAFEEGFAFILNDNQSRLGRLLCQSRTLVRLFTLSRSHNLLLHKLKRSPRISAHYANSCSKIRLILLGVYSGVFSCKNGNSGVRYPDPIITKPCQSELKTI